MSRIGAVRRRGGEAVEDERVKAGGWPRGAHRRKPGLQEVLRAVVEPAQRVDHGQQRDRRLVEPDALPGEDLVAVGAGVRGQLGDEPALAHAGLAADEHEAWRARARSRHRGDELAQLVRAADEDGARDARRHRPSIAPRWQIRHWGAARYVVLQMFAARRGPTVDASVCSSSERGLS